MNVQTTTSNSKIIILVGIALLAVFGTLSVFLLPTINNAINGNTEATPQAISRPLEVPQITQRKQITRATRITTQLNPWGIAIDHKNGFVWVAEPGCEMSPICAYRDTTGMLGKYSQADGGLIAEYPIPRTQSNPLFLEIGSDGRIWFTQPNTDAIGIFDPITSTWRKIDVSKGSAPYSLVFDKNGNLWFTALTGNKIGFVNSKTYAYEENIIPTFNSNPYGITMAPDGTIWFTENNKGINKIGSFTPTTNGKVEIQEHLIIGTRPHLITADQQGNIWFTLGFSGTIGRYNPGDDTAIAIKVTDCLGDACTHTSGIAADQKGKIWFTDSRSQHIGYYSPSENKVVNTKLESKDPAFKDIHPHDGLVVDSYGTVWFTEQYRRALVMAPGGRIPK